MKQIENRCDWRSYPPSTNIIDKSSPSTDVFFIVRGMVRVVNFSESGKEISLNDIESGSMFGELSAIDGKARSANVVAVYATRVASMSPEIFWQVVHEHPNFNKQLLERLTSIIRVSVSRIMDLSTLSAHGRVYGELLRLAKKRAQSDGSGRISPIPIHSEMASRISTTRETVARILGELNRKNIVVKERNVLVVNDIKVLEALHRAQM
ncbi:MAG: Crp/Fnr family transcriptional regulator [Alphaproteobacteria bacterium]